MTVYVDKLKTYSLQSIHPRARRHGIVWAHLFADSLPELHEFAELIFLKKRWFQVKAKYPHYDITPSNWRLALKKGAVLMSTKQILKIVKYNQRF